MQYWKIAVEAHIHRPLTYSSPLANLQPGISVSVPLGNRTVSGVILDNDPAPSNDYPIKEIVEVSSERPALSSEQVSWAKWLSNYYHHPIGEVINLFFPPLSKKGRSAPRNLFSTPDELQSVVLSEEQKAVYDSLKTEESFSTHLLWGVTGSGKTEIYIDLIRERLKKDEATIVLLPEIALTPQLVARFREKLGDTVAVIHSELTDRERTDQWWSMVDGQRKVVIGARSALFCPVPKLGLIVVDEEHESSFKQDEKLKYHARDAAIMRAQFENCPILLGTATPSLESWKNVVDGKFKLHKLLRRAKSEELPEIEVVDLTKKPEFPNPILPFWLSEELFNALTENYQRGNQSALFLNRRGIAQTVLCSSCGFIYKCPNCEISLTLHGKSHLVCHYCDYSQTMSTTCPDCKDDKIKPLGMGTEQVEEDLKKLFPSARVLRVDRDEIDSRAKLDEFVEKMQNLEVDFLVGTQMIAKGLDFQKLTLVGIVLADIGFNIPDFRAGEKSFQLLTQVSGRSGRHEPGRVLIQTYRPDHPSLVHAMRYQTEEFLNQELVQRQELSYPPYTRMACLRLSGLDQKKVLSASREIAKTLRDIQQQQPQYQLHILGPAPAPLLKIRNKFRYQILLKSASFKDLHAFTQYVMNLEKKYSGVKILIDVDPHNLL